MKSRNWIWSRTSLLLAAILVPPVGLILLWLRPAGRIIIRLLGTLAIVVLSVSYLFIFFDLRFEVDGTGMRPIVSFGTTESRYSELEQHRVRQINEPSIAEATDLTPRKAEHRYWTQFRGPNMDGHYNEMDILTSWPAEGLPLLWRQPVGGGYASFAIADGRAFTIEQRRHKEVVAAYELDTGREIWTYSWEAEFRETMGGNGPRATPTWHEGRVYALGATGELRVLDAQTGDLFWGVNILADNGAENLQWGMVASPLIVDEMVIALPGGSPGSSVAAYHKLTGEPIWKSLDDRQAYTSPMLVNLAGVRQILVVSRERIMGLRPEDGSFLWGYPWSIDNGVNVAQPVIMNESRVFISTGYGRGAAVFELRRGESGFSAHTVWENTRMKNKFTSSVLHDGYIYGLDEAILACIDPQTGERMWKGGRYGYGQVLAASGHLIVSTERGELVLVEATPESHREVARFAAIQGKTWNHPAIADGVILVRNAKEMAAYAVRPR